MKITTLALSAFGLAGLTAAQNGNDPLILNNRTGLDPVVYDTFSTSYTNEPTVKSVVSVPLTPSPVRSNTFLPKPTTSIQCWRNGYPCGQNGGQRSQRLVADFVEPTPTLNARVPPSEWFSSHSDVNLPGETDVPGETGELRYDILPIPTSLGGEPRETVIPEPTDEVSMGILPIPTFLGGEPRTYDAPPQAPGKTSEAIFSVLPITTPTPAAERPPIPTEWWRGSEGFPHATFLLQPQQSRWPEDWWRGPAIPSDWFRLHPSIPSEWLRPAPTATISEGAAAPSQTVDCNLHFCATGTLSSTSTPPSTPLPTIPGSLVTAPVTTYPTTSSHFAIPTEPEATIIDTYTESTTSDFAVPSAVDPLPAAAPPVVDGQHELLVYCDRQNCVTIRPSDDTYFGIPAPTSGFAMPPEATPPATAAPAIDKTYTMTIDCNKHYCTSGMQTVYTITPTPYTYTSFPSPTSGFVVPPEPNPVSKALDAGVPIDWWRGPGQPVLPDAPEGINGPIQRHSSVSPILSVATNDPCYRHYCPPRHSASKFNPMPTTMLTTVKLVESVVSATLHFQDLPPHVTFTA